MNIADLRAALTAYPDAAEVYVEDPDDTFVMRTIAAVGDDGHWLAPSPDAVYLSLAPWDGPADKGAA
jgi:hypothetical protein